MPYMNFLSIDYPLTLPRHSRIITRIKGSYFIMKKIAILLFILMFLTGGYASAHYISSEPKVSFDKIFDGVDDVFIVIDPAQISSEYFKSNQSDTKFDLFPNFLKRDSLRKSLLQHFNAGYFKSAKIHFIERSDLFDGEVYKQVNDENALLVMIAFKWGTFPKENNVNTNWSIRLFSYYYRSGAYNSPHLLLMNTETEIFFPKCPDCSFQVDQSTQLDNFFRTIARNITDKFN